MDIPDTFEDGYWTQWAFTI